MKKRILIIIYALLLCVTASLAWLPNYSKNKVEEIFIDYKDGALTVADPGFLAHIETLNSAGSFEQIAGDSYLFDSRKMVPDSLTPFKIKIHNNSATEYRKAKLGIGIRIDAQEAEIANILDVLYLEIVSGAGFDDAVTNHVYLRLNEASVIGDPSNGEYFLWIYGEGSEILIPPSTSGDDYVTLDCSLYFDQNATQKYQNKSVYAMAFRLE